MQTQQEERKRKGNITELLCYIWLLDKATRRNKLEVENEMETMLYFTATKHNKKRNKWKQK
jgi:hypothetical protein